MNDYGESRYPSILALFLQNYPMISSSCIYHIILAREKFHFPRLYGVIRISQVLTLVFDKLGPRATRWAESTGSYISLHEMSDSLFDRFRRCIPYRIQAIPYLSAEDGIVEVIQFSIEAGTSAQAKIASLLLREC